MKHLLAVLFVFAASSAYAHNNGCPHVHPHPANITTQCLESMIHEDEENGKVVIHDHYDHGIDTVIIKPPVDKK